MGKDLHFSILSFFNARMTEHSMVQEFSIIEDEDNYLYVIERHNYLPDVIVHLSDSYLYNVHEYYSKPSILKKGDYILIARPEAKYTPDVFDYAFRNKIGLGKIGEFMSSLNKRNVWEF